MRLLPIAMLFAFLASPAAHAEKADRDKPVNLEADRVSVDDKQKVQVFEGNVQLTEGTLVIRTDRLVVTQDADGFQRGVATGGPGGLARFRQKREGKDEYVDGSADRIDHDDRSGKTEFFGHATVKSGLDELHGNYILYDANTEHYLVTSAPTGTPGAEARDSRVRAVIQPKKKEGEAAKPGGSVGPDPASLKAAPQMSNPRQE